jgi:transcriptional regulator with XRE-family HTH domain
MTDSVKVIAARLLRTREALDLDQSEFCEQIGVKPNVYNPFETGKRRITVDVALKIRARFGVSLDWIYCGDPSHLPTEIYRKLAKAA